MKLIEAYQRIKALNVASFQTRDIGALLKIPNPHASKTLERLTASGLIIKLSHGHWALAEGLDILQLPELITAPFPSYISLQTALYYQGLISQIPSVIYAVTLSRSKQYKTSLGTVSTHSLAPDFFCGYKLDEQTGIKMAVPEKSLIDLLYLNPSKTRLFSNLPEVEFPDDFDIARAREFIARIPCARRRKMVENLFNHICQEHPRIRS